MIVPYKVSKLVLMASYRIAISFICLLMSSNMVQLQNTCLRFKMGFKGAYVLVCDPLYYCGLSHVVPWAVPFILLFDTH